MKFEWDENKNASNIHKHGMSFEQAQRIFDGFIVVKTDTRREYGEERKIAVGEIDGLIVAVIVYTVRNQRMRIISARRASANERKGYYEVIT